MDDTHLENGARLGPNAHLKHDSHSNRRDSLRATVAARLSGFSSTNLIVPPNESTGDLKRLQVFDEVVFLLVSQPETETRVIAVDDVEQGLKPSVVVETTLVLREHEQAAFTNKQPCKIHCLVSSGCAP